MKKAWGKIIAASNSTINVVVMIFLILLLIMGCYVLWDTKIVHTQANKATWTAYKPTSNNKLGYDELKQINPDVVGWITIYGTGIDYPVLYNKETSYYLFKNAKGESSSIGSIFMDGKCSPDFSDYNTILYGHHMDTHAMFGDIGEFQKANYFRDHQYGNLFYSDTNHGVVILGYLLTDSHDSTVYQTGIWSDSAKSKYFNYFHTNCKQWRDTAYDFSQHLLILSTCSNAADEARSVLITCITDQTYDNPFNDDEYVWPGVDDLQGWLGFPWSSWFAALAVIILMVAYIIWQSKKSKKTPKNK